MKIYLVGGSVRDHQMGLQSKDQDWVVVGATAADMLKQGYVQVGADFPVFLHPQTHEEYALARLERKVADGYHGFEVSTAGVTLEEDLSRRDLTINAMAYDKQGVLVDPYGGSHDLKLKVLRHVGPAFSEDPVRILRVLRFHARFGPQWRVAEETAALMHHIVDSGEADHLVSERVWKETSRALQEPHAWLYLQGLLELKLLKRPAFSAFSALNDANVALARKASFLAAPGTVQAVCALNLDQIASSMRNPPAGVPAEVWRLAGAVARFPMPPSALAEAWLKVFDGCAAFKGTTLVNDLFSVWSCRDNHAAEAPRLLAAALAVDTKEISAAMTPGPSVGEAISKARLNAIESALKAFG